jgi:hypothetical protein
LKIAGQFMGHSFRLKNTKSANITILNLNYL